MKFVVHFQYFLHCGFMGNLQCPTSFKTSDCCLDLDSTLWCYFLGSIYMSAHCTAVRVVQYRTPTPTQSSQLHSSRTLHSIFSPLPLEWTLLSLCGLGLCSHTHISHASLCNTKPPDAACLYTESLRRVLFKVCFSYRKVDMCVRAGVGGQFIRCSEQFIPFCSLCIYTEIVDIGLNQCCHNTGISNFNTTQKTIDVQYYLRYW